MKSFLTSFFLLVSFTVFGQSPYQPERITSSDYKRAEKTMSSHLNHLVKNQYINPVWTDNDNFWYTRQGENGTEKVDVNAKRRRKSVSPVPNQDQDFRTSRYSFKRDGERCI